MILRVGPLAESPLDAAAQFHAEVLPEIRGALAGTAHLTLVFAPAGHGHCGWRLAAVQELARHHAPARINAVAGTREEAFMAAAEWLAQAEGITGQYLGLDETGAGSVVSPQQ
jgi:hypothetical protein